MPSTRHFLSARSCLIAIATVLALAGATREAKAGNFDYQSAFTDGTMVTYTPPGGSAMSVSPIEKLALETIDFAAPGTTLRVASYELKSCDVLDRLVAAKNRGVTVLIACEQENYNDVSTGFTPSLGDCRDNPQNDGDFYRELEHDGITVHPDGDVFGDAGSGTLHSKFIVATDASGNKKVWAGSANLTPTGLGSDRGAVTVGANREHALEINDSAADSTDNIAAEYEAEQTTMMSYAGGTHVGRAKKTFVFSDATVEVAFSPCGGTNSPSCASTPVTKDMVRSAIQGANSSIDVMMFFWNDKDVSGDLKAKTGTIRRVAIDAVGAAYPSPEDSITSTSSQAGTLCEAGIPVKIEDFGGKIHHKAMVADNNIVIAGSTNWTSSGFSYNDEDMLKITGNAALSQAFTNQFNAVWTDLDDRLNCCFHSAEAAPINPNYTWQGNASNDGRDNDYDGFVDASDPDTTLDLASFCTNPRAKNGACTVLGGENTVAKCNDGLSNDHDAYIDGNDFDCPSGSKTCSGVQCCSAPPAGYSWSPECLAETCGYPPPDTTPPSAPNNLSATSTQRGKIKLTWSASTDNVGVTGYNIYRCSGSCTPNTWGSPYASAISTSYTNNVTSGSTWSYSVKTKDAVGNLSGLGTPLVVTQRAN